MNLIRIAKIIGFLLLIPLIAKTQVTIGTKKAPEDYAILQIEGVGGLRLPKVEDSEKTALETSLNAAEDMVEAPGLLIYNTTYNRIEYWDKSRWVILKKYNELNDSENGVVGNGYDSPFSLGGSLSENTTLDQGSNNMNLFFDETTGKFIVSSNEIFQVSKSGVKIGPVADTTPITAALDVSSTTRGTALRYENGTIEKGHVLVSNNEGDAEWRDMKPNPYALAPANILNVAINNTTADMPVDVSSELELTKGIWMLIGRFVATSTNSIKYEGNNTWLRFVKRENQTDPVSLITSAAIVAHHNTTGFNSSTTSQTVAAPQIACLVEVEDKLYIKMQGNVQSAYEIKVQPTSTSYGDSYLRAIRLTEDL